MGMSPDRIYAVASGISLATAGVAGVMVGMSRTFQPFDGPTFLLVAFGVVILGGLGSMVGALVGGVMLGHRAGAGRHLLRPVGAARRRLHPDPAGAGGPAAGVVLTVTTSFAMV